MQFTDQPKGRQYMEKFQYPILPQGIPHDTQHLMHDFGDSRNQCYSALHYKREQFEHAAQKHQRVAYEEVQTAAALATSRTAAQMTFRFRDIENNAEAILSQQQRGLLSEITYESAHSLIHEAAAEMMRRDTRREDVLSLS